MALVSYFNYLYFIIDEIVKGRIYLYDDSTKTLILKLWKDSEIEEQDSQKGYQIGMGVYNALNVSLEKIHPFEDLYSYEHESKELDSQLSEETKGTFYTEEFTCSEDSYNKREMDRLDKFCEDQVLARRKMLDQKYGQKK